jgi:hypothetical protein
MLGSLGDDVRLVQQALNRWNPALPPLEVDGIYGPVTTGRVREFQSSKHAFVDGVVGPETWGLLKPWIDAVVAGYTRPPGEEDARRRIVDNARSLQTAFGWIDGDEEYGPEKIRIAANKAASPTPVLGFGDRYPRQGGVQLATIFRVAGHLGAEACLTITTAALNMYRTHKPTADERNRLDVPSWCGIFATHVMKIAGLRLPPWRGSLLGMNCFTWVPAKGSAPVPGDIGILDPQSGGHIHHVVVVDSDGSGNLETVEGNEGIYQSIILGHRTTTEIGDTGGIIVTPVWSKVLAA